MLAALGALALAVVFGAVRPEELLVIAAPKTLGELRKHWHKDLESKLAGEIAKDLTGHSSDQIAAAIEKA